MGLGDHWIPNDPKDLLSQGDLDDGLGRQFNADVRQHIFASGLNTPVSSDGDH